MLPHMVLNTDALGTALTLGLGLGRLTCGPLRGTAWSVDSFIANSETAHGPIYHLRMFILPHAGGLRWVWETWQANDASPHLAHRPLTHTGAVFTAIWH